MGRSPDYKASFMAGLGADPAWYGQFSDSAEHWYRKYAEGALFLNHVLINPPIDRSKPVHDMEDVFVHVVKERDDGMVVSGAKMLATGSALTHATFVAQNSATQLEPGKAEDFALVFIAPLDTPGQKLLSRRSYEATADSPFDHPLSSRFDENDAVIVFDNAFIPWENVLVYRDVEKATGFYAQSGFLNRYTLQAGTRLAVKLDFLTGLISRALETNGTDGFRGVQAELGELFGWRSLLWSITTALCHDTRPGPGESIVPNADVAMLVRLFGSDRRAALQRGRRADPRRQPAARARPARRTCSTDELRPLIDRFYRGSSGSAEERVKLFKLIWDAMGSEFGARHEWYERNYGGSAELVRLDALRFGKRGGALADCQAMVDQCMSDYDLDGWTGDTWT